MPRSAIRPFWEPGQGARTHNGWHTRHLTPDGRDQVWEQDDFWLLSPAALRTLLDCDKCEISSENNLFHILRTWLAKVCDLLVSLSPPLRRCVWTHATLVAIRTGKSGKAN